jgi:hypothetical protein
MNTDRSSSHPLIVSITIILLLLSACQPVALATEVLPAQPPTQPPAQPSDTPVVVATQAPTLGQPSSEPSSDITLDYSAVAQAVTIGTVAAQPARVGDPWWVGAPQYRHLTLQGYPITNHSHQPEIFIYPANELSSANENMGKVATDLHALLQTQQAGDSLPMLPLINAKQALQSQVQYIDFEAGNGIRFLTQLNQGLVPINNHELIYTFQALTSDGKYYVAATLPVSNSELPDGSEPSEDFIKGLTETPGFYADYISTTVSLLNQQPDGSFTPDLQQLDALVRSITIPPAEEVTPTPEIFIHAPIEGVLADKTREDLASRLGVDFAMISVVETTHQDWPDVCLGLAPSANQECTQTTVPGWRIVLNAAGHTHEYRSTEDGSLVSYSGPVGFGAPEACTIHGTSTVYSLEDGYCFAYPVRFHRTDERGPVAIYGPSHGPGPEPLYASLTIAISSLPAGQTLENAVDAFLAGLGDVPMPQTRLAIMVADDPALMLEVVPGMLGSRDVFLAHNDVLFQFTFWPAPSVAPDTAADVEDIYQTVLGSLTFTP